MAEKESAVAKYVKDLQEKAKAYKTTHDVERVHHLMGALHLMRDYPAASSLAASFGREVQALSLKQKDLDAKAKEEDDKALAEAQAADAPKQEEKPEAKQATQADWRRT